MNVQGISCSTALDTLLRQVGERRQVRIVRGVLPIGALIRHECTLNVTNLPARNVLAGNLSQLGARRANLEPVDAWVLMYDPHWNAYFLSTSFIPDLNPEKSPSPPPPADTPAETTGSGARSRLSAPVVKKP
jgi:hypothetical protein